MLSMLYVQHDTEDSPGENIERRILHESYVEQGQVHKSRAHSETLCCSALALCGVCTCNHCLMLLTIQPIRQNLLSYVEHGEYQFLLSSFCEDIITLNGIC